jgi:hypothetical protein
MNNNYKGLKGRGLLCRTKNYETKGSILNYERFKSY